MERQRPLKQIRAYCLYCMNGNHYEVKICASIKCGFYHYRLGKNKSDPRVSALRQIKKYCAACGENPRAAKTCPESNCSLHNFRQGKNPFCIKKAGHNMPVKLILRPETASLDRVSADAMWK